MRIDVIHLCRLQQSGDGCPGPPAKSASVLVIVCGLIARSTMFESISKNPHIRREGRR
jgi:hypothetical protein